MPEGLLTDPETREVTEQETSQFQLGKILDSGGPLMTASRTRGKQTAQNRGLLNSSMAAGAAELSMIESATPFALADASRHGTVADKNLDNVNAFKFSEKGYAQDKELLADTQSHDTAERESSEAYESGERALDREHEGGLLTQQQEHQTGEREAGEEYQASENLLDRDLAEYLQDDAQGFQTDLEGLRHLNTLGQLDAEQLNTLAQMEQTQRDREDTIAIEQEFAERIQNDAQAFEADLEALRHDNNLGLLNEEQQNTLAQMESAHTKNQEVIAIEQGFAQQLQDDAQAFNMSLEELRHDNNLGLLSEEQLNTLAQMEKQLENQQVMTAIEQQFSGDEAQLDRELATLLQDDQQGFQEYMEALQHANRLGMLDQEHINQLAQMEKDLSIRSFLQKDAQTFENEMVELQRLSALSLLSAEQEDTLLRMEEEFKNNRSLQEDEQDFAGSENALDREMSQELQDDQQAFTEKLTDLQNKHEEGLLDTEQRNLMYRMEAELNNQMALQNDAQAGSLAQQREAINAEFQLQADEHANQITEMGYSFDLSQHNVSGAFAAGVSEDTYNAINVILTNPDYDAWAKEGAIQNIIDMANENLRWGSQFYAMAIPPMMTGGATNDGVVGSTTGNQSYYSDSYYDSGYYDDEWYDDDY